MYPKMPNAGWKVPQRKVRSHWMAFGLEYFKRNRVAASHQDEKLKNKLGYLFVFLHLIGFLYFCF